MTEIEIQANWFSKPSDSIRKAMAAKELSLGDTTCRLTRTITHDQLKRLFGLPKHKQPNNARAWQSNLHLTKASRQGTGDGRGNARASSYCFRTLEEEWWQIFQKKWKTAFSADWPYAV